MTRRILLNISSCLVLKLHFLSAGSPVLAQPDADGDNNILLMYFTEKELYVETPTRSMQHLSRTAENVTVVTSEDIELMNAHSVGDVLNAVTGVQVISFGGPGSGMAAFIQSSEQHHVAVFIDGILLNNLSDDLAELGMLPVQNIAKIEIIKGPASSAWGSALGGVVNIITKKGLGENIGGTVSASSGERSTGDFRADVYGKEGRIGYYLNAGRFQTDGFAPHFDVSNNNAYLKLTHDITNKTAVQYTLGYVEVSRGTGAFSDFDLALDDETRNLRSAFSLKTLLDNDWEARLSFWSNRLESARINSRLSTGERLAREQWNDNARGGSAEFAWKNQVHNLAFGIDSDSKTLESNEILDGTRTIRKSAVYLNDTISLSNLSVIPGIRYDNTSKGNVTSPSFGMTYQLTKTTVLRAFAAKGFSVPPLAFLYGQKPGNISNPDLKMERVTSYQVGAETAAFKYLWMKLSAFRHDIRDAISLVSNSGLGLKATSNARERRDGVEGEVKTAPVYNTSLTAGAEYVDIRDMITGRAVLNTPRSATDVGLIYDDEHFLKAMLKGRYADLHSETAARGSYGNFVFDLNAVINLCRSNAQSLEAFLTAHNLFNGRQYPIIFYKNPERWVEGGLRYTF